MPHLFTPQGEAALIAILGQRPLLAFDFDGTLAPIVARPDDARISPRVAALLGNLAARLPVAIVTGRAVEDVRGRLGFEPRYVVGNHGAEDGLDPAAAQLRTRALDPLRQMLRARGADLAEVGVIVEDKGQSVALHYRLARSQSQALAQIHELLEQLGMSTHSFGGKMVVNVVSPGAPDKAQALRALVWRCGATCALFTGDDLNDEPVFISAPPGWLTVRVGHDNSASRAKFSLDSQVEMAPMLERMLTLLTQAHPV